MGAWQMANNKIALMNKYESNYDRILNEVMPHISHKRQRSQQVPEKPPGFIDTIYLIIGSERGLCGRFNISIAEKALSYIKKQDASSYQIWVMGSRLLREVDRRGGKVTWRMPLPASSLFTYQQSYTLAQSWLEQFETFNFNHFVILHNQSLKSGIYRFSVNQLLPYQIKRSPANSIYTQELWPPPIIETDPKGIYNRIIQHFIAFSLHQSILKSSAAEHSTRYNLMQEASDNAEDIIEDLLRVINAERKRKITEEMQELAVSAGLLEHE